MVKQTDTAPTEAGFASVRAADIGSMTDQHDFGYGKLLQDLRLSFAAGTTKSLDWRRSQLEAMITLVRENHEAITEAVRADHGGYKIRGLFEFMSPIKEAETALANLKKWTSPKKVTHDDGVPINFLSKSEIRSAQVSDNHAR
jgi:hypothetical protein